MPSPPPLRFYRNLKKAGARKQAGLFLVEGPRYVRDVIAVAPAACEQLLVDKSRYAELLAQSRAILEACPVRILDPRSFARLADTKTAQGIIAVMRIPAARPMSQGIALALNRVQDPGNVGALIRSAVAFGVKDLIVDCKVADPYGPKAVRASAGAVLGMNVIQCKNLAECLGQQCRNGARLYCLDPRARKEIASLRLGAQSILVLGGEGLGLEEQVLDLPAERARIPIGNVESLNAAIAGSLALYLLTRTH